MMPKVNNHKKKVISRGKISIKKEKKKKKGIKTATSEKHVQRNCQNEKRMEAITITILLLLASGFNLSTADTPFLNEVLMLPQKGGYALDGHYLYLGDYKASETTSHVN